MEQEQVNDVMEVAAKIAGKSTEIKKILVIYQTEDGTSSVDNGLEVGEANLLIDTFKFWLLHCMVVR